VANLPAEESLEASLLFYIYGRYMEEAKPLSEKDPAREEEIIF
jgi:hypothetical protein